MSVASVPEPSRRTWVALGVLATTTLMTILDGSIVTVALPAMQADLGFSPGALSWVVNAYLLGFGSLLLLAGRLGDLIGRRRVFLAGTAIFTAASALAGVAASAEVLLAARFLQGVGSAAATAVSLGILVTLFGEGRHRGLAIAIFSFTGAAGAAIGQVAGGILTGAAGWPSIFLINLPIGVAAIVAGALVLPADRGAGLRAGADVLGALLVTAGLALALHAVVTGTEHGFSGAVALTALAAAVLLAAFLARQARTAYPLMPLRIFRSRAVAGANAVQVLIMAAMFGFQVLSTLFMQRVLGWSALETGLAMLPAALLIGAISLGLSAPLMARFGARAVLLAGLALLALLFGWLTRVPVDAEYLPDVLPAMLLAAGAGLVLPALTTLGMSGAGPDDAGLASGVFNTTQQIGMALGVAVLSGLAATHTQDLISEGTTEAAARTGGYRLAFAVGAALILAAMALAAMVLRPAPATAPPEAARPVATR
ncbi:MFS transporter [Catenuloplanes atrovinosus]|uniref:EmrB/QacA subfamily drug resistance transporter n=1 Tax=Catenuloplanes atrovinosus TaxID=137266 RepID=A0AAE3YZA9_9ACTN|nr:MFS transporter [Catenuloplanes atrovinosus]MDR7280914.1 EmrB/QacA subfamily drug resistance transporter [Catenuloplanes atrovinosus]